MKKIVLFIILLINCSTGFSQDTSLVYSSKREVKLLGASNFRDLGGYPTRNRKHVKWGHIYRSADISKLTDADLQVVKNLQLAIVCDLRGPDELKTSPDRLPEGIKYVNLPAGSENVRVNTNYATMNRDSMMQSFYTRTDHLKAKYQPVFEELLSIKNGKGLMFHCTAGKDRTGMGAALILSALGVPKEYVIADYAATNVFWKDARERMKQTMAKSGMSEKEAKAMLAANPQYIETFLQTIDSKYGSMDKFLEYELELDKAKLTKLRSMYLE
jgi:protein-tyrosine phosphatase